MESINYIHFTNTARIDARYGEYVTEYNVSASSSDYGQESVFCRARFFIVDIDHFKRFLQLPLEELMRTRAELLPYYHACFNPDNDCLKTEIRDSAEYQAKTENLFIVDRLEVLPEYRGHGLSSTLTFLGLNHYCDKESLVVSRMSPLQFEDIHPHNGDISWRRRMHLRTFTRNQMLAREKLRHVFLGIGFNETDDYEIVARSSHALTRQRDIDIVDSCFINQNSSQIHDDAERSALHE